MIFTTWNFCVNGTDAEGITPLRSKLCRWEEKLYSLLKKYEVTLWTGVIRLWIGTSGTLLWICHEPSGYIKGRTFLDCLRNYWLFKALLHTACK